MNPVAFLWKDVSIYWSGLFTALGILAASLAAGSLQLWKGRSLKSLGVLLPAAVLFSLVLGRACHWYCHPLQYESFASAMSDFSAGGLALPGAFAGVLLAAVLVRLAGLTEDLPGLLDALAPAGALGLTVGRLGSLYDLSCRGSFLPETEFLRQMPFSAPVITAAGTVEWRFATFLWQSAAAFGLFLLCLTLFFRLKRPENGHVFALFLTFYAAVQVVLDSTRYDGGYLPSNGFISLTQLCCVALLAGVCAAYSVRSVRVRGLRLWHCCLWAAFLALGGAGGYMEYFVQRHGDRFALAYSVMAVCFLLMAGLVCILFHSTRQPAREKEVSCENIP